MDNEKTALTVCQPGYLGPWGAQPGPAAANAKLPTTANHSSAHWKDSLEEKSRELKERTFMSHRAIHRCCWAMLANPAVFSVNIPRVTDSHGGTGTGRTALSARGRHGCAWHSGGNRGRFGAAFRRIRYANSFTFKMVFRQRQPWNITMSEINPDLS